MYNLQDSFSIVYNILIIYNKLKTKIKRRALFYKREIINSQ